MRNEKSPVPPEASASPRNFALSRSCDLPRVCRICGAPALPKECRREHLCRKCYNAQALERYYKTSKRKRRIICKVCGRATIANGDVCWKCLGEKHPFRNDPEGEAEFLKTAIFYNRKHPFAPEMMQNLVIAMQRIRGNCQPSGQCVTRR